MKKPDHLYFFSFCFQINIFDSIKSRIEYDTHRYYYERVLTRNYTGRVTLSN
jgi:hypothetical protein